MSVTKDQYEFDDFNIYLTRGQVGDSWITKAEFGEDVVWAEQDPEHAEKWECDLGTVLTTFATCFTGRVDIDVRDMDDNPLGRSKNLRGYMDLCQQTKQGTSRPGRFTINFTEDAEQVCLYPKFDTWHEWTNAYMQQGESMAVPTIGGRRHVLVVDGTVTIDGQEFTGPTVVTITDQEAYSVGCVSEDVVAAFCVEDAV